ncbi:MAG: hypothetical protein ACXV3E_05500, partial [Halobacteriota archaeon]
SCVEASKRATAIAPWRTRPIPTCCVIHRQSQPLASTLPKALCAALFSTEFFNDKPSHSGDRAFESLRAHCFLRFFEEIAGSAELIEPDHRLSTFEEKSSALSETRSNDECSAATAPVSANNDSLSNHHAVKTLSDLALPFTEDELSSW